MSRRFQFSLKALLVAMAIASVIAGIFCDRIRSQNAAIAMIEGKGGDIMYFGPGDHFGNWSQSPAWLRPFDGYRVYGVYLLGHQFSDDDLPKLRVFPRLTGVVIGVDAKVTEAGIESLRRDLPHCHIVTWDY